MVFWAIALLAQAGGAFFSKKFAPIYWSLKNRGYLYAAKQLAVGLETDVKKDKTLNFNKRLFRARAKGV